jgi:hypothetical protein
MQLEIGLDEDLIVLLGELIELLDECNYRRDLILKIRLA